MKSNKEILLQYAGLATQLFITLGVSAYLGLWLDKHFLHAMPIFVWILPLIVLIGLIIKVIKDTSK
jgi:F0F1-type ATP synthase assembly protein I